MSTRYKKKKLVEYPSGTYASPKKKKKKVNFRVLRSKQSRFLDIVNKRATKTRSNTSNK